MYSESVKERRRHKLSARLGFEVAPRSIGEVEEWTERLADAEPALAGAEPARSLSPEEVRFISHERSLSAIDFLYWATRYAWIENWDGHSVVRFVPNVAQRITLDTWAEMEDEGVAIETQDLKARQLGISTVVELAVDHRVEFWTNVHAVIGSSDPNKSEKMEAMMRLVWSRRPWWLGEPPSSDRAGQFVGWESRNCWVSVEHGNALSGIARGTTPSVVHLSEIPDYSDPEELIEASLLKAVHPSAWTLVVLESTAAGRQDWWARTWRYNKLHWPTRTCRMRPKFLPWFVGSDIYPTDSDRKARPVPESWHPSETTALHAARAREYVKSDPLLRKYLGADWQMPRDQMWYWQWNYQEAAAKGTLNNFLREMPADDIEAFQSSSISVFSVESIADLRVRCRPPLGVFKFRGAEVPECLRPSAREVDVNLPPIEVVADWSPTASPLRYSLVPIHWTGCGPDDGEGLDKLFIWHLPSENERYAVAFDTGDGIGQDRTAGGVIRKGTLESLDAQVAEIATAYVNAAQIWPVAMALETFYSVPVFGRMQQARFVVEVNRDGDCTQLELRKRGIYNFHHWTRIDQKRIAPARSQRLGWHTVSWSRAAITSWFIKNVRDGALEINSPYFVDEMADFERDENRAALRAASGAHDDRILYFCFGWYSLHYLELKGGEWELEERRERRRRREAAGPEGEPGEPEQDVQDSAYALPDYEAENEGNLYSEALASSGESGDEDGVW